MRGISESKFKPIQSNFDFSITRDDQHNPQYQFSFKDLTSKPNQYSIKEWKQRAKSTRHTILNNKSQLSTLEQDNNRLEEIVKHQRKEIDKLKLVVNQHNLTYSHLHNSSTVPKPNEDSYSNHKHSSQMNHKYQAVSTQSPITIKPFSYTSSTINYRSDSPGYTQIHSKRTYRGESRLVSRDQEEIYKLKINNLNEMIEYMKRERELMDNQYTVKEMEWKGYIRDLELRVRHGDESKEREVGEMVMRVRDEYEYQLKQIIKSNNNKRRKNSGNLSFCHPLNILISPKHLNTNHYKFLQNQLLKQQQLVVDLKNKLKQQSLNINQQANKILLRFQQDINNESFRSSTRQNRNNDIMHKFELDTRKQQLKDKIEKLQREMTEMKSRHQLQLLEYRRMNQQLTKKYNNRQIQMILLQQKLNIQECYKEINQQQTTNKQDRSKWQISEIPLNTKEQNQLQSKYQSQVSTIFEVKELKEIIEEKDMNIAMLIEKYQKIQVKLLQVISFNHQVNNINKLIINERSQEQGK